MLYKEFVPYEPSLDMKELGFDEPCFGEYRQWDGNEPWLQLYQNLVDCSTDPADYEYTQEALAPTFSQAFRWFREKYKLHNGIYPYYDEYEFQIKDFRLPTSTPINGGLMPYEEAELECLIKLIEIANKIKYSSSDVPTYYN